MAAPSVSHTTDMRHVGVQSVSNLTTLPFSRSVPSSAPHRRFRGRCTGRAARRIPFGYRRNGEGADRKLYSTELHERSRAALRPRIVDPNPFTMIVRLVARNTIAGIVRCNPESQSC
jgi:hypothetical protein